MIHMYVVCFGYRRFYVPIEVPCWENSFTEPSPQTQMHIVCEFLELVHTCKIICPVGPIVIELCSTASFVGARHSGEEQPTGPSLWGTNRDASTSSPPKNLGPAHACSSTIPSSLRATVGRHVPSGPTRAETRPTPTQQPHPNPEGTLVIPSSPHPPPNSRHAPHPHLTP
jgi:hypothetical protein